MRCGECQTSRFARFKPLSQVLFRRRLRHHVSGSNNIYSLYNISKVAPRARKPPVADDEKGEREEEEKE